MLQCFFRTPGRTVVLFGQQVRGLKRAPRSLNVILKKDVAKLGLAGTEVCVNQGFARNNLYPKQEAVPSTAANREAYIQESQAVAAAGANKPSPKESKQMQLAVVLKKLLRTPLVVRQKVEEEGSQSLAEPVTGPMICDAVARQMQVQLAEELLDLPGPIVEHGEYNINLRIKLGEGARARLLVNVLPVA
ncbi:hypothetical protein WJX74_004495 [Apatococcus lobatus]|uniref:Large ribosomal subunit protein bL9c n=1 Tax=Apatococcus lobatus TaxID=904363 RepID=A0AAW1QLU4_9CHLO